MMCWQDLTREFVTELIYPAVQANAIYEVNLLFPKMSMMLSDQRFSARMSTFSEPH
jgi:argininosuccinate synthase